ncbi:hypothetical protein LR48_Vigan66s000600 [Vigna angularis]|uniref:Uncharacterized protein n=1 Tax=Phaseolus angularis TaxID=3914 RepID=A0A0L9T3T5_PHAAN|nr:hypothetical protein LR48_Vigan66s000600 [Vigna angularis]
MEFGAWKKGTYILDEYDVCGGNGSDYPAEDGDRTALGLVLVVILMLALGRVLAVMLVLALGRVLAIMLVLALGLILAVMLVLALGLVLVLVLGSARSRISAHSCEIHGVHPGILMITNSQVEMVMHCVRMAGGPSP